MKGFIGHVLNRHMDTGRKVMPRLPGRFEASDTVQENFNEVNSGSNDISKNSSYKPADNYNDKAPASNRDGTESSSPSFDPILNPGKISWDDQPRPREYRPFANELKSPSPTQTDDTGYHTHTQFNLTVNSSDRKSIDQGPVRSENIEKLSVNEESPHIPANTVLSDGPLKFEIKGRRTFEESQPLPQQSPFFIPMGKDPNANPVFFKEQGHQPVIKVTIGRIDVKAIIPPPVSKRDTLGPQKPVVSLNEYLKNRDGNK